MGYLTLDVEEFERLERENRELKKEVLHYRAKEALNRKQFDFWLCNTAKGNVFIKVIYDSYESNGWVEVARIHLSKSEWVRKRFNIKDILDDLKP